MPKLEISQYQEAATQIVQEVFALMLGNQVDPLTDSPVPAQEDTMAAMVSFVGSWSGTAVLQCGLPVARKFSSQLMGIPESSQSKEDIGDSMGELINMIGGNLKSMLPRDTLLSPPSISTDAWRQNASHGSGQTFCFRCEWGPFWLALLELAD